jgi:hypothetical protein
VKLNTGTKIRTALAIAVSIHTALIATDVTGFQNPTVDLVYKVFSIVINFIVVALTTYYNNDYSEEACIGTGITRQLKAEQKEDYKGEKFFDTMDGEEEVEDDE